MLKDLIMRNRSYRRFFQNEAVGIEILKELVELARLCPSASNLQPLRYILCCKGETNEIIFKHLAWAGFLKNWDGPEEGERPAAYIIILGDTKASKCANWDAAIAAQTILLGATEKGLGGCIIGSVQKDKLSEALNIPAGWEVIFVLAIGKPKEKVVLDQVGPDGDIKYWRDDKDVHHVPKRSLEEIIIGEIS